MLPQQLSDLCRSYCDGDLGVHEDGAALREAACGRMVGTHGAQSVAGTCKALLEGWAVGWVGWEGEVEVLFESPFSPCHLEKEHKEDRVLHLLVKQMREQHSEVMQHVMMLASVAPTCV